MLEELVGIEELSECFLYHFCEWSMEKAVISVSQTSGFFRLDCEEGMDERAEVRADA